MSRYTSRFILCLFLLVGINACQEEDFSDRQFENSVTPSDFHRNPEQDHPYQLSIEEAYGIVYSLNLRDPYAHEPVRRSPSEVLDPIIVPSEQDPKFYIFNYEEGGFAVLSADLRVQPLLAFSDKRNMQYGGENKELITIMNSYIEYITHQQTVLERVPEHIQMQWGALGLNTLKFKFSFERAKYGPLLATEWGQSCAYNGLMPACSTDGSCNRAWTGCVATAMAQIVRYHEQSNATSFNWGSMPNGPVTMDDGVNDLDQLMSICGSLVGMDYGCDASGAYSSNVPFALYMLGGYSANHASFASWMYVAQIIAEQPVYLSGVEVGEDGGHAWIGDGYMVYKSGSFSISFYHMNWGWNGDSNGWFTNFDGYEVSKKMIIINP